MSEGFDYVEEDWKRIIDVYRKRLGPRAVFTLPPEESSDWDQLSDFNELLLNITTLAQREVATFAEKYPHLSVKYQVRLAVLDGGGKWVAAKDNMRRGEAEHVFGDES